MDCIKNGYCMAIYEFTAYCVPFETIEVEFSIDTVPLYTVKFPNGELREYNEFDLKYTKEQVEKMCVEMNEKLKGKRKYWFEKCIPTIKRYELTGM